MSEANLDALCDLLGESDDSFDEAIFNIVENEVAKIDETDSTKENETQHREEPQTSAAGNESSYVTEMERKLQQMQEEMRKMQEQLEAAKSNSTPPATSTQRKLEDVDLFGQPSTNSSGAGNVRALRSPVKTNPFQHLDKPRQQAKFHPETPQFGPKVSQKTTRVLSTEEKLKLQQEMKQREKERRMKSLIAGDLADSSDDEKEDPTVETYNDFGKAIKRIAKTQSQTEQAPFSEAGTSKPVGFNALQGSEINLSCQSANRKLPKNMIIEKHTKIRIANPTITQISLDLSLMGRKMIPMNRIRNAIIMGETNSDWTTIGINYMKATQKSKNGNTYTMWKMTDLVGDIQVFS